MSCTPARPSAVPTDDCECLQPEGCLPCRVFVAERAMRFSAWYSVCATNPMTMPDPKYYLTWSHPDAGTFSVNRWTLVGTAVKACGAEEEQFFSTPITPGDVQSDLDQLFAVPWPDPDTGIDGRFVLPHNRNQRVIVVSTFESNGAMTLVDGVALRGIRPWGCCWAENWISMVLQTNAQTCDSGFPEGADVDAQSPWRTVGTRLIQARGQVRAEPGAEYCLYDLRANICSGVDVDAKINCRKVGAGSSGIIDIPLPPLGYITVFDEFCECL